ncbi:MAG: AAA family ATPase [Betaproteobacteria bacterium]
MYQARFGLKGKPFSILPDPECLFLGRSHHAAMVLLEHAAGERPGFVVVTGGVGTGKTTLLRRVMLRQPRNVLAGFIANPHPRFGSLLGRVLQAFGIETLDVEPLQMIDQLELFIGQLADAGRRALLVVDEAQVLGPELLDELRMLSNIVVNGQMPQVILSGQAGLRDTLRCDELQQLVQRVVADCELQPLGRDETRKYIEYRLAHAGARDIGLFDDEACAVVYEYTGGVPRLINILCEDSLIFAGATNAGRIDASIVLEMANERVRGGVLPLARELAAGERRASFL